MDVSVACSARLNMVNLGVDVGSVVAFAKAWKMNAGIRVPRKAFKDILTKEMDLIIQKSRILFRIVPMSKSILYLE